MLHEAAWVHGVEWTTWRKMTLRKVTRSPWKRSHVKFMSRSSKDSKSPLHHTRTRHVLCGRCDTFEQKSIAICTSHFMESIWHFVSYSALCSTHSVLHSGVNRKSQWKTWKIYGPGFFMGLLFNSTSYT